MTTEPLQLTVEDRDTFFYPTGHTGQYVVVAASHEGQLAAQLTIGLDEAHPLWPYLTPATVDTETALRHLAAVTAELAAVESLLPGPTEHERVPV